MLIIVLQELHLQYIIGNVEFVGVSFTTSKDLFSHFGHLVPE
ncbi:hypothetical protein [Flavobacterium faecale]